MTRAGAIALSGLLSLPCLAQAPEAVLTALRNGSETERSAAIMEIAQRPHPSKELLNLVADALLDPAESVRQTAAYAIPRMGAALGCRLEDVPDCEPLKGLVSRPKQVRTVPPRYPGDAKEGGLEGDVLIQCLIRENGAIERASVMSGPGPLRAPALAAFKQWTYGPALRNDKPVPLAIVVPIRFRLR